MENREKSERLTNSGNAKVDKGDLDGARAGCGRVLPPSRRTPSIAEYVVIIEPGISSVDLKSKIEGAANKVVVIAPGSYTVDFNCLADGIRIPVGCVIVAYGATITCRETSGALNKPFFRVDGGTTVLGGIWRQRRN